MGDYVDGGPDSAKVLYYIKDLQEKYPDRIKVLPGNHEEFLLECPFCSFPRNGKVYKVDLNYIVREEIREGKEPYFDLDLWYLRMYKSNLIWALNREHLEYLYHYISADLREHGGEECQMKTASDHLPTYMKRAKNRAAVLKILQDMFNE